MKSQVAQIVLRGLEQRLPALRAASSQAMKPSRGWLRAVREAASISQHRIAQKLGVRRQSYADLELAEQKGSVTLNSLERAADAMGCELVYFVVPRERTAGTYTELARLHDPDFKHLEASEHSMGLEGQSVGDLPRPQKPSA